MVKCQFKHNLNSPFQFCTVAFPTFYKIVFHIVFRYTIVCHMHRKLHYNTRDTSTNAIKHEMKHHSIIENLNCTSSVYNIFLNIKLLCP